MEAITHVNNCTCLPIVPVCYTVVTLFCVCSQDFVDTLSDLEISDDDAIDQLKHFHAEPYDTVSDLL